ncbi:MAG: TnpV protein [Lachnospirales bacterium]
MENELSNNRELQEHIKALFECYDEENDDEIQLGRFGRMAFEFLEETNPQKFMSLKMQGKLISRILEVEVLAKEMTDRLQRELLQESPMPKVDDILVRTRHLNKIRSIAE